jgi:NitT/TauT family transport system ATP-binding protein
MPPRCWRPTACPTPTAVSARCSSKLSLSIRRREIVALLGGSGCGKSTLLRVLAGLAPGQRVRCAFWGSRCRRPHPRSALVFQQASLLPWLKLADNVGFGLDFAHQPKPARPPSLNAWPPPLLAVGLAGREAPTRPSSPAAWPSACAGPRLGSRAGTAVCRRALLGPGRHHPRRNAGLLVDVVHRWHTAALLVTHDIDEAILVADRIVLMGGRPGRLLHEWTVDIPRPREDHPKPSLRLRLAILGALRHAS